MPRGLIWLNEHFATPWLLTLAGVWLFLPLLWWWSNRRRRRALRAWLGEQPLLYQPRRWPARLALWGAAVGLVLTAAGPLGGTAPEVENLLGRDLVIVLDVSRSMLAEDRPPYSRLERAKSRVRELLDHLQNQGGGHRIGIIIFAGQARLLCPLTADYEHLRFALSQAHPDLLGPGGRLSAQEPAVGTSFRPAVELALQQPAVEGRPEMDFLFITDGDDLAGDAESAASLIRSSRLPWHLYGVGVPDKPAWIPSGNPESPFLLLEDPNTPNPQRATTQRRDELLKQMGTTAQAALLLEDFTPQPLVSWWQRTMPERPPSSWLSDPRSIRVHLAPWFFAAVLVLLVVEIIWGEGFFPTSPHLRG